MAVSTVRRRARGWCVLLAFAGAASGCGGGGDGPAAPTPTVQLTVSPTTSTIQVGQSTQFAAAVVVTGTASSGVTWSLSNPSVGTITANGNSLTVVGAATGSTDVVATSQFDGTKRAVASLTVVGVVQGISVAPATQNVVVGGTVQLTANVTAVGASTAAVFTSSNSSIARIEGIDATGRVVTVRGVAPGTATITVRAAADTSKVTTATVVVASGNAGLCSIAGVTAAVAIGQTITGELTAADCGVGGGAYADLYRLVITGSQGVEISLASTAFDAYLRLVDANGNLIAQDDNGGGGSNARMAYTLAPGTYYVAAGTIGPVTLGAYTLSVRVATGSPPPPNTICSTGTVTGGITPGQTVTGTLTTSDCDLGDGSFADIYTLTISTAQAVQIDLTSTAFDAYLILIDGAGNLLAADDDGGGGSNARIVSPVLSPGTYYIAANSIMPATTGAYSLSVRQSTAASNGCTTSTLSGTIAVGQTVNGALATTDCTLNDGSRADLYTLTLATSQAVQIDLTSTAFDPYLIVYGATGNIVASDDDSGEGLNARISRTFAAGTYYVAANTAQPTGLGAYTLSLRPPAAADAARAAAARTGTSGPGWAHGKAKRAAPPASAAGEVRPLGKPRPGA